MDERSLRKRLNRITAVAIVISLAILAMGSAASVWLRSTLGRSLSAQMEIETEKYRLSLSRLVEADIQTLNTLASFVDFEEMDADRFAESLLASREDNNFQRLGYLGKSGYNIIATADSEIRTDVPVESLEETMMEAVRSAWNGETVVSDIYQYSDTGEEVCAYAVPVFSGNEVTGALAASISTDVLEGILNDRSVLSGRGYIYLISGDGRILVSSENGKIDLDGNPVENIFSDSGIDPDGQEKLKEAIAAGEQCFEGFREKGTDYRIFLEPLRINGWFLVCVQVAKDVNSIIYQIVTTMRIVTMVVLVIVMLMIIYGYRLVYLSNRSLIQSAYYDNLTGAYNLAWFTHESGAVIEETDEYSMVAMNVRQFKFINEIFGVHEADLLLCHIKKVVEENVEKGECYCRSGEDMFYILLRDTDRKVIRTRLEKMIREISQYAISSNRNYRILLYCGVVIGSEVKDREPSVQKSMTHVRFALDTARQSLKNSIWFYDLQLHEDEKLENYVESRMHQALENREFKMFLQPKIGLASGKTEGAEALVRWIPDDGRVIYPGQFIPLFESNGFCVNLDMYMVENVCRQIREWIDEGLEPIPLSVNQSKLLFYETDYIDNMKALLEKYKIPADLITLEILEGLALENIDELNEKISRLKALGFRVSMDDFGSGYSSFNTLASLKIDELKLDRVFLMRLTESDENSERQKTIMKEIVELTKKLKITTVAEGVETKENEEFIRSLGCDFGQGYYYSRPISAEEFSEKYL